MAEVEFELLEPNQPNAPSDTAGVNSIGLSNPDNVLSGTLRGTQNLGTAKIRIDSSGNNIIVSDGTNDRILIGFQQNGF